MNNKIKLVHQIRAIKSKKELANIVRAQRVSEKVLRHVLAKLRTGISEIEVAGYIMKLFVKEGFPILAFSPIVAFGDNTSNIHHEPGKSKLKKGDLIMFDFGTTVEHYCSDMTRTYFWGEPSSKQKRVYSAVLEAQRRAIEKLAAGERRAWIVDGVARNFLLKKFPNNFRHGLGHGVGTAIHEWPNFKAKSRDILPTGCVMTVEPGIYLKNFGGVRIEDMILITKNGSRNLTKVPKDLRSVVLEVK
jgi:Xaa-Pro aminopeptidase